MKYNVYTCMLPIIDAAYSQKVRHCSYIKLDEQEFLKACIIAYAKCVLENILMCTELAISCNVFVIIKWLSPFFHGRLAQSLLGYAC